MAFDFPTAPTEGQIFNAPGGPTYQYLAPAWRISGPAAVVPPDTSWRRNRIVNPAMQITQENGNTALTTNGACPADQWSCISTVGPISFQRVQVATANGSTDRLRMIATTGTALPASGYMTFVQNIEGFIVADFRWGMASARPIIVRFGLKAPAGTYSIVLRNQANNRSYIGLFTISAGQANTDTEQVLVVPGDMTGTWVTDTGLGLQLWINFACGSSFHGVAGWQAGNLLGTSAMTNGGATTGNTFELFDVGLYLDVDATSVAPKWDLPDYGAELLRCRRYYAKYSPQMIVGHYGSVAGEAHYTGYQFQTRMRVVPSSANIGGSGVNCTSSIAANALDGCRIDWNNTAVGGCYYFYSDIAFNARM